jgi:hypothetical protein
LPARAECPPVRKFTAFARRVGAIPAYAYLGDVTASVTGDKKPQRFEDAFLGLLFRELQALGFQAVTYMPSRNTPAQLKRVRALCEKYGLLQICGEDINSPRQPFVCAALRRPEFRHLVDAAWALVGHEQASGRDPADGFFSPRSVRRWPDLGARIKVYREIGFNCVRRSNMK